MGLVRRTDVQAFGPPGDAESDGLEQRLLAGPHPCAVLRRTVTFGGMKRDLGEGLEPCRPDSLDINSDRMVPASRRGDDSSGS
jgi:hypothetical protein